MKITILVKSDAGDVKDRHAEQSLLKSKEKAKAVKVLRTAMVTE